ncbi:hypothetical protein [Rhodococcus tukisamuensis]|uniref:Uncharacterized protein n=1 Tax=Rhodococcus tukisamuensis TaxID=168276 RepID=A0A1G6UQV2_9NOCA|nr:hypothetical protein [Rhodococcus tukisamuensis]SDD43679.1 hypothetical protein SAMN05444580_104270 [Rhodococcus tukisamuensis]
MPDPDQAPIRPPVSRFRATSAIALGAGVAASVPALVLTGSIALCALIAVLTVAYVVLVDLMI